MARSQKGITVKSLLRFKKFLHARRANAFLRGIPGYAPDANGAWVDPNFHPQPSVSIFDDFDGACELAKELTREDRIREAAGYMTRTPFHSEALKAIDANLFADAAMLGTIFHQA